MKELIKKHYGGRAVMARELGVTPVTVTNWVNKAPRNMLKYTPELLHKGVRLDELLDTVLYQEHLLANKG